MDITKTTPIINNKLEENIHTLKKKIIHINVTIIILTININSEETEVDL